VDWCTAWSGAATQRHAGGRVSALRITARVPGGRTGRGVFGRDECSARPAYPRYLLEAPGVPVHGDPPVRPIQRELVTLAIAARGPRTGGRRTVLAKVEADHLADSIRDVAEGRRGPISKDPPTGGTTSGLLVRPFRMGGVSPIRLVGARHALRLIGDRSSASSCCDPYPTSSSASFRLPGDCATRRGEVLVAAGTVLVQDQVASSPAGQ